MKLEYFTGREWRGAVARSRGSWPLFEDPPGPFVSVKKAVLLCELIKARATARATGIARGIVLPHFPPPASLPADLCDEKQPSGMTVI